jgi:WD40 repeat protein
VTAVAFSPDGTILATASNDYTARLIASQSKRSISARV